MSLKAAWYQDKFRKRVKRGFAGYPVATIAYYGSDNTRASKVTVGVIQAEGEEPALLERWYRELHDVRTAPDVLKEILDFLSEHFVKSVVVANGILGCPHEEGKDYPDGEKCPVCSYWADRDRFTGHIIQ